MRVHWDRGPAGFLQVGPSQGTKVWLTLWWGGFTMSLKRNRLLCFRPPSNAPLFSERNGFVRHLVKLGGWRLFIRERHTI